MEQKYHCSDRIYSFDLLRVTVMFMVIVAHSALTYNVISQQELWPIKDPVSNNSFLDLIVFFVHTCSMPAFYLTAGFFGSLLFYERGIISMLKNRLWRLVLPFFAFVIILYPIITIAFSFSSAIFASNTAAFKDTLAQYSNLSTYLPKSTYHLWFLYQLIYFTFGFTLLALLMRRKKKLNRVIMQGFSWLIERPLVKLFFFSAISLCMMLAFKKSIMPTPITFMPDVEVLAYFSVFYCFGWLLYKSKYPLSNLDAHAWLYFIAAIVLALVKGVMIQYIGPDTYKNMSSVTVILVSAPTLWLFTFGLIGLFVKYGSRPSVTIRYISDASYWVYLIHLPLTVIIPALIFSWTIPAIVKFLVVLSATTIVCFLTYDLFVRSTFIGKFLNGKKYQRKLITVGRQKSLPLGNVPDSSH